MARHGDQQGEAPSRTVRITPPLFFSGIQVILRNGKQGSKFRTLGLPGGHSKSVKDFFFRFDPSAFPRICLWNEQKKKKNTKKAETCPGRLWVRGARRKL